MLVRRRVGVERLRRRADVADLTLGRKIREERERQEMTLQKLAEEAGLGVYQTLGYIETGKRKIQIADLVRIGEVLKRDFVTEYKQLQITRRPVAVLVRRDPQDQDVVQRFAEKCERHYLLENYCGLNRSTRLPASPVSFPATMEHACSYADEVRDELGLSRCPSEGLIAVLERKCAVPVDFQNGLKDPPLKAPGGFGKCLVVRGPKHSPQASYDAAKGLFHLLNWGLYLDLVNRSPHERSRLKELTKSFAACLLLPRKEFLDECKLWISKDRVLTFQGLCGIANYFSTTRSAVVWRFVTLNMLGTSEAKMYFKTLKTVIVPKLSELERFDFLTIRAYQLGRISEEEAKKFAQSPTTLPTYLKESLVPGLKLHRAK